MDWSIMTSYRLYITVQHENTLGAGADSWIFSQSVLEREVIKFCADQVPVSIGAACHSGVRSLQLLWGCCRIEQAQRMVTLEAFCRGPLPGCQTSVALCVRTHMCLHCVCVSSDNTGREMRFSVLSPRKFCLCELSFYWHQKTVFLE